MRKRVLFLHHNFPGQFKNLAIHLDEEGHDIKFMIETNYIGKIGNIDNIEIETPKTYKNSSLDGQIECGKRFLKGMKKLKTDGWIPDIVISHAGWGCGVFAKDLFPNCLKIAYNEWWFSLEAPEYRYDYGNKWFNFTEKALQGARLRNLSLSYELCEADAVVSPTKWQAKQLPKIIEKNTQIIHEGVDLDYFKYNPKFREEKKKRITYATRGLEPMRGFPQFVEAVIPILKRHENIEICIAGQDKIIYGGTKPAEGSYWKWAKEIFKKEKIAGKVKYLGHLNLTQYARLLKSSHVHVYLTRPFVASWSLLESMASGCCIVANKIEAVEEFVDSESTCWCDLSNTTSISEAIDQALNLDNEKRHANGLAQRNRAQAYWDKSMALDQWKKLLKC